MKSSKTNKQRRAATATAVAVKPEPQRQLWLYALALAVSFLVVVQVYWPAMNGPFLLDDTYQPYMQPYYTDAPLKDWLVGVRPLLMFSYWLNFKQSGTDTFGYHLGNVLLHFFNGILTFLAIRKTLSWLKVDKPQSEILAIFAGGLFLFHPLQTESVSYVASRSETLSVFFVLAALVVFLYRKTTSVGWGTTAIVLLIFGAAVLTKEHTAVLPALLLITDYYWNPGFSFDGIKHNWKLYVPIVIGGIAGVAYVFSVLAGSMSAGFAMKDLTWYQYFFTQCRVIWVYLRLFLLPFGQNADYDFPISRSVTEHGAIFGLVGLLAVSVAAWIYRRQYPLASYGWFVFLILLAPTSSFVPIRDPIAERRLYLPFIGLLFVTVEFLRRWKTNRTTMITALGVVLLAEGVLSYQRNELWGSATAIWRDTAQKSPHKLRPQYQLAFVEFQQQACSASVDDFAKAAQIEPPSHDLLIDWALAYDCAGQSQAAVDKLKQAAAVKPTAHAYSMLGREYGKMGKYPEALDALDKAAQLDPSFAMTYYTRGAVYESEGNRPAAIQEYRHALALDGKIQAARDALQRLGQ